jgi:hypothetical protein
MPKVSMYYARLCATNAGRGEVSPSSDAARKMKVGPSEPACGGRLQTTLFCCGKEPWWGASRKRPGKTGQVGVREANESEPFDDVSKLQGWRQNRGLSLCSGISPGDNPLTARAASGTKTART